MRRWFTEPRTMVSSDHRSCGRSLIRGLLREPVRACRISPQWICRGQTGVRQTTDPVRLGLLPSCGGAATAAAWGAVTARQEAAPDRVRHVTNSCLDTTDPSVVDPVPPSGLPEEPSDKLRPQLLWSELTIVKTSFTKLSEQKIFPKPFSEISKSISQSD